MRLKELIGKKKKDENIPGSVRSLTAEALGETPTQIARYESIDKNNIQHDYILIFDILCSVN